MPSPIERCRHFLQEPTTSYNHERILLEIFSGDEAAAGDVFWQLFREGLYAPTPWKDHFALPWMAHSKTLPSIEELTRLLLSLRDRGFEWTLSHRALIERQPDASFASLPAHPNTVFSLGILYSLARAGTLSKDTLPAEVLEQVAVSYLVAHSNQNGFSDPLSVYSQEEWQTALHRTASEKALSHVSLARVIEVLPHIAPAKALQLLLRSLQWGSSQVPTVVDAIVTHQAHVRSAFALTTQELLHAHENSSATFGERDRLIAQATALAIGMVRSAELHKYELDADVEALYQVILAKQHSQYDTLVKPLWECFPSLPLERRERFLLESPLFHWAGLPLCPTEKVCKAAIDHVRSWSRAAPGIPESDRSPVPIEDLRVAPWYRISHNTKADEIAPLLLRTLKAMGPPLVPALAEAVTLPKTPWSHLLVEAYLELAETPAPAVLVALALSEKEELLPRIGSKLVAANGLTALRDAFAPAKQKSKQLVLAQLLALFPASKERSETAKTALAVVKDAAVKSLLEPLVTTTTEGPSRWWHSMLSWCLDEDTRKRTQEALEAFDVLHESKRTQQLDELVTRAKSLDEVHKLFEKELPIGTLLTVYWTAFQQGKSKYFSPIEKTKLLEQLGPIAPVFAVWSVLDQSDASDKNAKSRLASLLQSTLQTFDGALPIAVKAMLSHSELLEPELLEVIVQLAPEDWKLFGLPADTKELFQRAARDKKAKLKKAGQAGLALDPLAALPRADSPASLDARLSQLPVPSLPSGFSFLNLPPLRWHTALEVSHATYIQILAAMWGNNNDQQKFLRSLKPLLNDQSIHALVEALLQRSNDPLWNLWVQWILGDDLRHDALAARIFLGNVQGPPYYSAFNTAPNTPTMVLWRLFAALHHSSSDADRRRTVLTVASGMTFESNLHRFEEQLKTLTLGAAEAQLDVDEVGNVRPKTAQTLSPEAERVLAVRSVSFPKFSEAWAAKLEAAMVSRVRWPAQHWKEHYPTHPILRGLARRLLWKHSDANHSTPFAFDRATQQWIDRQQQPVTLTGTVQLVHPCELSPEEQQHWSVFFADRSQPFEQLSRRVRTPDDVGEPFEKARSKRLAVSAQVFAQHGFFQGTVTPDGLIVSYAKQALNGNYLFVYIEGIFAKKHTGAKASPVLDADVKNGTWSGTVIPQHTPVEYSEYATMLAELLADAVSV